MLTMIIWVISAAGLFILGVNLGMVLRDREFHKWLNIHCEQDKSFLLMKHKKQNKWICIFQSKDWQKCSFYARRYQIKLKQKVVDYNFKIVRGTEQYFKGKKIKSDQQRVVEALAKIKKKEEK